MPDGSARSVTPEGSGAAVPGEFDSPMFLAVDGGGVVYVADLFNGRVQKFGAGPTPVSRTSWGRVKSLFR